MDRQQVSLLLQECLSLAEARGACTAAAETLKHIRESLPDDLSTLLQEAADRTWPFVEEKWQYKQSVTSQDKINSSELIRKHLPQLLVFLRESILAAEPDWAVAVVFLLDRLLYWMDSSHILLKIAKTLHKRYPEIPIAPQVIIRQARVYLNSGKLQKAEYILSSLLNNNNNASTGSWTYQRVHEQTLVQAVSLQVRGQVLQTLGLWSEAAELIWASLIGFYALPQPDKKGAGTSLGLLANIFTSMNDGDFAELQKKPCIEFSFLGEHRHRLLSAAQAAKMAVVYSQYGSLYVLTNVVAQGTCLLSYSFSKKCPSERQQVYLALAKEAFEIGLLTKTSGDTVTSKLELHTFLKAAYSLATTHRWISGLSEKVTMAMRTCQEAMSLFFDYCSSADSTSCAEIMAKIQQIKSLLKVESLPNSDPQSFIPDSYRSVEFSLTAFTLSDFEKVMDSFRKHHESVCEAVENATQRDRGGESSSAHAHCITAFQTHTEVLPTEHPTPNPTSTGHLLKAPDSQPDRYRTDEAARGGNIEEGSKRESSLPNTTQISTEDGSPFVSVDPNCETQGSDDEQSNHRSVQNYQSGSRKVNVTSIQNRPVSFIHNTFTHMKKERQGRTQELCSTEDSEQSPSDWCTLDAAGVKQRDSGKNLDGCGSSNSFSSSLDSSWEQIPAQNAIETLEDDLDPFDSRSEVTSCSVTNKDARIHGAKRGSASSHSLSDSCGSHSSWQKLSISPVVKAELSALGVTSSNKLHQHQSHSKSAVQSGEPSSTETDPSEFEHLSLCEHHQKVSEAQDRISTRSSAENNTDSCDDCFKSCVMGSDSLTDSDYKSLFAGVCQSCLIKRLPNKLLEPLEPRRMNKTYNVIVLKYSKASGVWTGHESSVYIGKRTGHQGKQRRAIEVLYLHQEQLLSRYVGKEYLNKKGLHAHLDDVERQMTAQYYVTEFNKHLYDNNISTQIFFIPSEVLLVLESDQIITCVSAEPYMSGQFVKLTNNSRDTEKKHLATKYGVAFGHFTYEFSNHEEVVVDLQGWVTANGKGLTYLTDPQIHSLRKPKSRNFHQTGINNFLQYQHGDECNEICQAAGLKRFNMINK